MNSKVSLKIFIGRSIVLWIAGVLGLLLMALLNTGIAINSLETAFVAVAVIGILNAILWPVLTRYTLPFLVATFGVGLFVLNAFILWLTSQIVEGFTITGLAYVTTPIVMAAITTIISVLLTIDDDASYFRTILRRRIEKSENHGNKKPGVIFTEIDGLSVPILKKAINNGKMPTLKRLLEQNSYKINEWEPDLSSQTGASQAGILHGNNSNMPAFRWVEKENNNKIVASNGASDAPILEARISNGNGLLAVNGASRSNLFSGDAEDVIFTYSKLTDLKKFYNKSWYYFYSHPENFPRTIALFLWDLTLEIFSRIRQRVKNVQPRLKKGFIYLFVRAGANVFMREVTTLSIVGDVIAGHVDVLYATYYGYDEVAHHNGIEDNDVFVVLKQLDKQFKRIESACEFASRDYIHVILSDHGQTNGATFKQRYGYTLESLVRRLLPEDLALLDKIEIIAPSHGQIWTDPMKIIETYSSWATGQCRNKVTMVYDTMHGSTQKMAHALAEGIMSEDVDVFMYFLHEDERSEIVKDILDSKAVLFGIPTVFNKPFPSIGDLMYYLEGLRFDRTGFKKLALIFGSHGWAGGGVRKIADELEKSGFEVFDKIEVNYVPEKEELDKCYELGKNLAQKIKEI